MPRIGPVAKGWRHETLGPISASEVLLRKEVLGELLENVCLNASITKS